MNFLFFQQAIRNLDLFLLGITSAAILILGFIAFFQDRKSITNKTFLLAAISAILYGVFNYINYQVESYNLILWFIRITSFFAVWYAFFVFQLFFVFPKKEITFTKRYKYILVPLVAFTSLLTLTPLVFSGLAVHAPLGTVSTPENASGSMVFGLVSLGLIIATVYVLARKTLKAEGLEKYQLYLMLVGVTLTYGAIVVFNLIFTLALKNTSFIAWTSVFTLPFIILTFYSIARHHLLNIKIISTEILVFVLAAVNLFEVLLTDSLFDLLIRILIFVGVVIFGILLMRSNRKTLEQKKEIEKLALNLQNANQELRQLDTAKSEFISIASHQLRTPLTVIKGYISMTREGSFGKVPPKIMENLEKVYVSNERLIGLVENLLDISRIESGRQEYTWKEIHLEDLAQTVVDNLKHNAKIRDLKLIFYKPKKKTPLVTLDADKIHEVMMNFVDNAIKYTEKGKIEVTVEPYPKGMVTFCVKDTGRGISEESKNLLFKKFSRGKGSFKVHTEGVGLGLYVAKMLIDAHGGKIWATSDGVNKGSTFCFSIPLGNKSKITPVIAAQK